jgi:hypothetical protein
MRNEKERLSVRLVLNYVYLAQFKVTLPIFPVPFLLIFFSLISHNFRVIKTRYLLELPKSIFKLSVVLNCARMLSSTKHGYTIAVHIMNKQ